MTWLKQNWDKLLIKAGWLTLFSVGIWSFIYMKDDGFWFEVLLVAVIVWIAYENGRERGRKEDLIKEETNYEDIARILSAVYLYKKEGEVPSAKDVRKEARRRERWVGSILEKHRGREAFIKSKEAIFQDPPEDFK